MTRIAVAAWLTTAPPDGAGRRLRALLAALPPLLERETLVVLHAGPPPIPAAPGVEFVTVPIPAAPTLARARAEQRVLPGLLRGLRAGLLHLESLPVPRRLPCPCALTVHDLRDLGPFRRRPAWLARLALARSAARSAGLIAPSAHTARALAELLPDAPRAHVVPGGLDPAWVAGPASPPPVPAPFLLHVGHLEPRKNLALLLAAYARAAIPPALVLAGRDGGSAASLRARAARLGLAGRVHFLGAVDDPTLRGLYRGAQAVLVPSLEEGFGMPALEALAFGCRVLVSDRGALPEVVGGAGIVLPGEDAAAWATALRDLDGGDRDAIARAALARAAELDSGSAARALLAAWRGIASGGQPARRSAR